MKYLAFANLVAYLILAVLGYKVGSDDTGLYLVIAGMSLWVIIDEVRIEELEKKNK